MAKKIMLPTAIGIMLCFPAQAFAKTDASLETLIRQCAPNVHPRTMLALIDAESSRVPYALNANDKTKLLETPTSKDHAKALIADMESKNGNFDVGLTQINSENFAALGMTGADLLDECANLKASQAILSECYQRAGQDAEGRQGALDKALSCYNTGSFFRGFSNGYVARVKSAAFDYAIPAIEPGTSVVRVAKKGAAKDQSDEAGKAKKESMASNDAFGGAPADAFAGQEWGTVR